MSKGFPEFDEATALPIEVLWEWDTPGPLRCRITPLHDPDTGKRFGCSLTVRYRVPGAPDQVLTQALCDYQLPSLDQTMRSESARVMAEQAARGFGYRIEDFRQARGLREAFDQLFYHTGAKA